MSTNKTVINQAGPSAFIWFLAWVGAVVYFVGRVDGFWNVIVAFFKACVWPAFVSFRVLELLNIR